MERRNESDHHHHHHHHHHHQLTDMPGEAPQARFVLVNTPDQGFRTDTAPDCELDLPADSAEHTGEEWGCTTLASTPTTGAAQTSTAPLLGVSTSRGFSNSHSTAPVYTPVNTPPNRHHIPHTHTHTFNPTPALPHHNLELPPLCQTRDGSARSEGSDGSADITVNISDYDVLMMKAPDLHISHRDAEARVKIKRFGARSGRVRVRVEAYRGVMDSEKRRGELLQSSELSFTPGQREATFVLSLPEHTPATWGLANTFIVELSDVISGRAVPGPLTATTVWTINTGKYPSDECTEDSSDWKWSYGLLRERTTSMGLYWQARFFGWAIMSSMSSVLHSYSYILIFDEALVSNNQRAVILACTFYLLTAAQSWYDRVVMSSSDWLGADLRTWMLAKWMHLDSKERPMFRDSDLVVATHVCVPQVIQNLHWGSFEILQATLKVVANVSFAGYISTWALVAVALIIPFNIVVLAIRGTQAKALANEKTEGASVAYGWLADCVENRSLFTTYYKGEEMVFRFRNIYNAMLDKGWVAWKMKQSTEQFLVWPRHVVVLVMFTLGVYLVRKGSLTVGEYSALAATFASISDMVHVVATRLFNIASVQGLLRQICRLLNTRGLVRYLEYQKQLDKSSRPGKGLQYEEGRWPSAASTLEIHRMTHIVLMNVVMTEPGGGCEGEVVAEASLSCDLALGRMYEVVAASQADTDPTAQDWLVSAFLQVVGTTELPACGVISLPQHMHVLYVSDAPTIFEGSLMQNLRLGERGHRLPYAGVWHVCELLGMSPRLLFQGDFHCQKNGRNLSRTERVHISLARALIRDPDVLVLERPGDMLPRAHRVRIQRVLSLFVQHSGVTGMVRLPLASVSDEGFQGGLLDVASPDLHFGDCVFGNPDRTVIFSSTVVDEGLSQANYRVVLRRQGRSEVVPLGSDQTTLPVG